MAATNVMKWTPKNVAEFVKDYFAGAMDTDLATKYGGTFDQAKKYIVYLRKHEGLPARRDLPKWDGKAGFELKHDRERMDFVKFLQQSRSMAQMAERFGKDLATQFLEEEHTGLRLFKQLNNYSVLVYVLLPVGDPDIKIEPRDWTYHIPPTAHNPKVNQPYELVNLPDAVFTRLIDPDENVGRIDLIPMFDVHYGHYANKYEKFLEYIRWIKENPHMYAICGGDLMENALDDGRGMSYDQEHNPTTQLDDLTVLLAPIAHKILCMIPGNHEARSYNRTGIDVMRVLATRLKIPYHDGPVYLSIIAGEHKFKLYVQHGYGNSQTKGGKLNSAGRPRKWTDFIQFYLSGHVHDPVVNSESCIVEDPANCRLIYPQQWTVIAPSFLRWESTYAYRAGFAPPGSGGVILKLYENGEYRAVLK